jgi:hypothetical protein
MNPTPLGLKGTIKNNAFERTYNMHVNDENYTNEENELISIIDEMVGAAVSMNQGAQSYDSFIKARNRGLRKIKHLSEHNILLSGAIKDLNKLI